MKLGFNYAVYEKYAPHAGVTDENFGVFSARFGNIYTPRQLVQLFDRAYGIFRPQTESWVDHRGRILDPFRPRIQESGFATVENLIADRRRHFDAVKEMFERCNVFIFTLGLTEAWLSSADGSVFPLCPGAVLPESSAPEGVFHNFGVSEVVADLIGFVDRLGSVNEAAKIMLTVSPVPLVATYENRHVLVSTVASKSALRAAVDEVTRRMPRVSYFPSYEIVTGPQSRGQFFGPDLREVTPDGVAHVMALFSRHYLHIGQSAPAEEPALPDAAELSAEDERRMAEVAGIICDEEALVQ
jgi:hypothetical protein